MATQTFSFQPGTQILTPVQAPQDARMDAAGFAPSKTFVKGQALGRKTSDNLLYPLDRGASDGTQTFVGFSAYSFKTDSNGKIFLVTGSDSAIANVLAMPQSTAPIYVKGTFDPQDLVTGPSSVSSATAEVLTFTPANPTTGDVYAVYSSTGALLASFVVGGTQTAAATVTGLTASWNANSGATAIATASGTSTFVLTAVTKGTPTGITGGVSGTGTFAKAITTAAAAGVAGEVDTFTPGGSITTGDVYTLTATFTDLSTRAVSFTVGATTTAGAVSAGLIAAWNADGILAALATASGSSTVVLTSVNTGQALSVAGTVVGTGTVSKATTTPIAGRSISDILPGAPGARVLHNGFWQIP